MIRDDRHLSQGKQQNPDSETQDTLGSRETTLPRPEEDGPEGLGVGGGRVAGGVGQRMCLSPCRARLGGFSHQEWGGPGPLDRGASRSLRLVWFKPSRLSWGD